VIFEVGNAPSSFGLQKHFQDYYKKRHFYIWALSLNRRYEKKLKIFKLFVNYQRISKM
jgi:hypothetical protein